MVEPLENAKIIISKIETFDKFFEDSYLIDHVDHEYQIVFVISSQISKSYPAIFNSSFAID